MVLCARTFATENNLPMQISGQCRWGGCAGLKVNEASMPNAGNIEATAFAALPVFVYGHGFGQRGFPAG